MEYQKIANLLESTSDSPSKFRTTNWVEINDDSRDTYTNADIKYKSAILNLIYAIMQMHTYLLKVE